MIKFVGRNFGISVTPLNTVNKLTHYSPNHRTSITGNFGYFTRRDKEKGSIKGQLYSQLKKTEVKFNQEVNYKELLEKYDFVIVADGKPDVAEELGCWTDWISGFVKGAVMEGKFDPNELIMWINKTYCKNGYAYLTPFDSKRASLELYVPDTNVDDIDYYWDLFMRQLPIECKITETFKVYHASGHVFPHKIGNILLTGSSGGVIDPFLGFGQMKSIVMGSMAARSIVKGLDYDKMISNIYNLNLRFHELRKTFDKVSNKQYDLIVKSIGFPGVKPIIYDSSLNVVKIGASALKLRQKIKGKH